MDVNSILESLWDQLKKEHLPKEMDHRALRIFCRESDDSVHELSELGDIIKAVGLYENVDSLFVGIRTDVEKLGENKWVACFCDASQAENAMERLLVLRRNGRGKTDKLNPGVTIVVVRETDPTWKPSDDNEFERTFQKCWDSFSSLKQQRWLQREKDSFLQIKICEKFSLFSIETPTRQGSTFTRTKRQKKKCLVS